MQKMMRVFIAALFAIVSTLTVAEPLDVNTANADQLSQVMVGVGKVKAAAIIQDREQNGRFNSIDDLTRVKGVKSSTIDKNRDKITVGQAAAQPSEPPHK